MTVATAIPVPEPYASQLRDARQGFGDPEALGTPTHVTLLGPTDIDQVQLRAYEDHLAAVAKANTGFGIHLRGTGSFRPVSPVVFVALAEGISSCEQLAAAVRSGPVHREHDFPYHPHITVAQELPDDVLDHAFAELADFEAQFPVTGFTLYEHVDDTWRVHREYELTG
ncbi:MAG: 2'-5' RNA ligase family protein [Streptosporangiales bacterium]|nr:2'-5' RNA ligase family protein [Streptosporangiales bacterium]